MRTLFGLLRCWSGTHDWEVLRHMQQGREDVGDEHCVRCGRHVLRYGTWRHAWAGDYARWFERCWFERSWAAGWIAAAMHFRPDIWDQAGIEPRRQECAP